MYKRWGEYFLTFPSMAWLILFFLIPTLIIFGFTFKPADIYGSLQEGWTLQTLFNLFKPGIISCFWRTLWISIVTTLISLSLSLPIGYYIARAAPKIRHF